MTFIPEGTSSPFTKNFAYSFIYDKKKHLVWSISIEQRELWHLETVKRSRSTAMFRKCTSPKIVHEFIHSSAFLAILMNCRFPLTYSCVLFGGRLKFLLLRWMSASCSDHGSSMKVPCELGWYGIPDTIRKKLEIRSSNTTVSNCCYHLPCSVQDYALVCATVNNISHTDRDNCHVSRKSQCTALIRDHKPTLHHV